VRLARPLARRLDRLSRAAHRFHRFAHHPLCDRYAGELVRVGRTRLCRGCTYAVIGGAIGGIAGLVIHDVRVAIAAAGVAALSIATTLYRKRRVSKLATRFAPAALFTFAMVAGVCARSPLGLAAALAAAASAVGLRLLYGKRGADRTPCETCPERVRSPCSGFERIVSRERAFQRVAAGLISVQAIRRSAVSSASAGATATGTRIERSR
jgi:hypothetical protein